MRKFRTKRAFCKCKSLPSDEKVVPNLAITPSQMAKMVENGQAVTSQFQRDFFDGENNPSWEVPVDRMRGVDIVETWEEQKSARKHINDHRVANEKKYGNSTLVSNS